MRGIPTFLQFVIPANDSHRRCLAVAVICFFMVMPWSFATFAQVATNPAPLQFSDAPEERRFHALVSELRCVMCQNQSLADSNAQIAHDLRSEVLVLMRSGRTDAQVEDFLVERYGEFVLYRPRLQGRHWLLWLAPGLLLLVGGAVVSAVVKRQRSPSTGASTPVGGDW